MKERIYGYVIYFDLDGEANRMGWLETNVDNEAFGVGFSSRLAADAVAKDVAKIRGVQNVRVAFELARIVP